jgi:hypothetical protein
MQPHGADKGQPDRTNCDPATSATIPRALLEQLRVDLQLKEADNRFLQVELEKKDAMLDMLTEGLKEVEVSQLQWLSANQELSQELERAYQVNELLHRELQRLTHLLYGDADSSADTVHAQAALSPVQSPFTLRSPLRGIEALSPIAAAEMGEAMAEPDMLPGDAEPSMEAEQEQLPEGTLLALDACGEGSSGQMVEEEVVESVVC